MVIPRRDLNLQIEFQEFLQLFDWKPLLSEFKKTKPTVADIGARNFVFAPIIDQLLKEHSIEGSIHGIEIDAYRLLWGFHTRKDWGEFYARKARHAIYYPMDFLLWRTAIHLGFMLNPFVSKEPLLAWGLPMSQLKPEALFNHAFTCLKPHNGVLILSCPSEEEFELARVLAKAARFTEGQKTLWKPKEISIQKKPRYGLVLYSGLRSGHDS